MNEFFRQLCLTAVEENIFGNKIHLDQIPRFGTFKLRRFIPSQRRELVKIHLVATFYILYLYIITCNLASWCIGNLYCRSGQFFSDHVVWFYGCNGHSCCGYLNRCFCSLLDHLFRCASAGYCSYNWF